MSIKFGAASLAFALSTSTALAGGFERSGLPVGFMFEKGNYGELSLGHVTPKVEGATNVGSVASGNIAGSYRTVGVAFKSDLNEKLSLGITIDPSYGADVSYGTGTSYPVRGSSAKLRGETIALLGRYKLNDKLSVVAGVRSVGIGGNVSLSTTTITGFGGALANFYNASFRHTRDIGYLFGAAYEKPEIALRVGLTYASSTKHTLPVTGSVLVAPPTLTPFTDTTDVELPQSLTLDFQSGVAADTLVFGSVRWVDWTATTLIGPNAGAANPLTEHDNDSITYNIGVGRKFSDQFSGAISIGYEKSNGGIAGNLSPTDGYKSIQVGGTYTMGNMKISGGVRYVDVGDALALSGASNFTGNSAIGVGVKVGFTF
ncbi:FadL Long-chain fatty acid transport protein [Paracoccaceae bacterium]